MTRQEGGGGGEEDAVVCRPVYTALNLKRHGLDEIGTHACPFYPCLDHVNTSFFDLVFSLQFCNQKGQEKFRVLLSLQIEVVLFGFSEWSHFLVYRVCGRLRI